ncbi:MAG: histidinol-phosphate transaminase [Pyramidobacter sp.]|nr:histidinol-phosphate transaminase [Pyramidobacter sp.]
MKKFFRPEVFSVEAYPAGELPRACVRVCANENSRGVSPKALAAMTDALVRANRYPDSRCTLLRKKLAQKWNLDPDGIIVGNGLDGAFTMLGRAFFAPGDEVVCSDLTFGVYADTAKIMGATPIQVPVTDTLEQDADGFVAAMSPRTKMVVCCNPNNPTGAVMKRSDVMKILSAAPESAIVLFDEAYIEYADDCVSGLEFLADYPNVMVCRTFSKLYGLAGVRLGWVAARPELIEPMYRVREPFCVTDIAAAGAAAALDDEEYAALSRRETVAERERFCSFLGQQNIPFVPSQTNFVCVRLAEKSEMVLKGLAERGIYVRAAGCRGEKLLRISLGTPEENRSIEQAIAEILA